MTAPLQGLVLAAHGRHYVVKAQGQVLHCVTRGKKSDVAVGDQARLMQTAPGQAVIEEILPRATLLYRSDQYKSKLLAANLDRLFIVVATEPSFSDELVSRALVAAEAAGITPALILNKTDVSARLDSTRARLRPYAELGYPVLEVSAQTNPQHVRELLLPLLAAQSSILIGQSGMGKSSLINILVPDADIAVREISIALNSGKHTTTYTRLYHLDNDGVIVDSPGFQEFGLHHLTEGMLERAFPEFAAHLGGCRFHNCHHVSEPGCAILDALATGQISPARHALYLQLRHESMQTVGY